MKIYQLCVLVILGIYLTDVNANTLSRECDIADDLLKTLTFDDYDNIQELNIFTGIANIIKKIYKTFKAFNCILSATQEVLNTTQKFINDVQACGTELPANILEVLKSAKNILKLSKELADMIENKCKNFAIIADDTEYDTDDLSIICSIKVVAKMHELLFEVKNAVKQIKKLPVYANQCVQVSISDLQTAYNNYPQRLKDCTSPKQV